MTASTCNGALFSEEIQWSAPVSSAALLSERARQEERAAERSNAGGDVVIIVVAATGCSAPTPSRCRDQSSGSIAQNKDGVQLRPESEKRCMA
jgi:hypothetical protein